MAASRIQFHALTDRGVVRTDNQDAVFAGPLEGDRERYLFAVADGVGGREGGAWASERTLQLVVEALSTTTAGLRDAVLGANRTVFDEAATAGHSGAATTLTALLVEGETFSWANVGDSRAYILRDRKLHQLTRDHSFVEEEIAAGRLTRREAATSPHRNVITRSVGFQAEVEVDGRGPFLLETGDTFLLCSDGLYQLVSPPEMTERALLLDPKAASEALIRLANERGSPDNVSAVICAFEREALTQATARPQAAAASPSEDGDNKAKSKLRTVRFVATCILGGLVAGLIIGLSRPFW